MAAVKELGLGLGVPRYLPRVPPARRAAAGKRAMAEVSYNMALGEDSSYDILVPADGKPPCGNISRKGQNNHLH